MSTPRPDLFKEWRVVLGSMVSTVLCLILNAMLVIAAP